MLRDHGVQEALLVLLAPLAHREAPLQQQRQRNPGGAPQLFARPPPHRLGVVAGGRRQPVPGEAEPGPGVFRVGLGGPLEPAALAQMVATQLAKRGRPQQLGDPGIRAEPLERPPGGRRLGHRGLRRRPGAVSGQRLRARRQGPAVGAEQADPDLRPAAVGDVGAQPVPSGLEPHPEPGHPGVASAAVPAARQGPAVEGEVEAARGLHRQPSVERLGQLEAPQGDEDARVDERIGRRDDAVEGGEGQPEGGRGIGEAGPRRRQSVVVRGDLALQVEGVEHAEGPGELGGRQGAGGDPAVQGGLDARQREAELGIPLALGDSQDLLRIGQVVELLEPPPRRRYRVGPGGVGGHRLKGEAPGGGQVEGGVRAVHLPPAGESRRGGEGEGGGGRQPQHDPAGAGGGHGSSSRRPRRRSTSSRKSRRPGTSSATTSPGSRWR